jgi:hypothetical protein
MELYLAISFSPLLGYQFVKGKELWLVFLYSPTVFNLSTDLKVIFIARIEH